MKKQTYSRRLGREDKYAGILSTNVVTYSSDDNSDDLKAGLEQISKHTVESDIAQLEDGAREMLSELICLHKAYDDGRETLLAFVPRWLMEQKRVDHLKKAELEPEYRAAKILFYADNTREAIAKGDAKNAVWNAMRLMQERHHLILSQYEYLIRVGEAQLNAGRKGIRKYEKVDKAKWLDRARELIARSDKRPSNTRLANKISKETKAGVQSVRKHLDIHLPNPRKQAKGCNT
ncbi:MAG: hypothetical protein OES26_17075 [Gammaproteobacteria bacterium]|nr:hypothetical protein [Gammaproteobacteria bacterium]